MTTLLAYAPVKAIRFTDAYRYRGPRFLRPLVRWANRLGIPWGVRVKDWTQFPADAVWPAMKNGACIKCKGPIEEAPPGGVWGAVPLATEPVPLPFPAITA